MAIEHQTAAAALKEHFGLHLAAGREEVRRPMAEVLRERFGLSGSEAGDLVKALEEARTIRWLGGEPPVIPRAPTAHGEALGAEAPGGAPLVEAALSGGQWPLSPE